MFSATNIRSARFKGYEGVSEGVWVTQHFTKSDTQGFIQCVLNHAKGPWVLLPWGQPSPGTASLKRGGLG